MCATRHHVNARARRYLAWTLPVVVVAALAVVFTRATPIVPIPDYAIHVAGGEPVAGDLVGLPSRDTVRLAPQATLIVTARPWTHVDGPIAVRAFLIRNGVATTWDVPVTVGDDGSATITGNAASLFPEATGDWAIVLAVGRPQALPASAAQLFEPKVGVTFLRCRAIVGP
jgi:hypothetical protein